MHAHASMLNPKTSRATQPPTAASLPGSEGPERQKLFVPGGQNPVLLSVLAQLLGEVVEFQLSVNDCLLFKSVRFGRLAWDLLHVFVVHSRGTTGP